MNSEPVGNHPVRLLRVLGHEPHDLRVELSLRLLCYLTEGIFQFPRMIHSLCPSRRGDPEPPDLFFSKGIP